MIRTKNSSHLQMSVMYFPIFSFQYIDMISTHDIQFLSFQGPRAFLLLFQTVSQ
jgi:hypothetical protein